mmetsp:Transcript_16208/g.30649  ORF Transcript_16208/g.30649 Transcript_16208/m.30649 type:complete len:248 (-) Transcript_16208:347-1090(-)
MSLLNYFLRLCSIQILFIESKSIERLVIRCLVPTEPFPDSILNGLGYIINIIVLLCKRIIHRYSKNLPVQLSIINHGKHSKRFDFSDRSHCQCLGTNFNDIDRIIISKNFELGMFLIGILPRLWKTTVVPEDGSVVITKFSFLHILRNWVRFFLCGNLHLGLGHLGDLHYHVVPLFSLERDVVPGRDDSLVILELKTERLSGSFSSLLGGYSEKSSSRDGSCASITDGSKRESIRRSGKGKEGDSGK